MFNLCARSIRAVPRSISVTNLQLSGLSYGVITPCINHRTPLRNYALRARKTLGKKAVSRKRLQAQHEKEGLATAWLERVSHLVKDVGRGTNLKSLTNSGFSQRVSRIYPKSWNSIHILPQRNCSCQQIARRLPRSSTMLSEHEGRHHRA
jgi:hypothetical protein